VHFFCMNNELLSIANQFEDVYAGDPWFGKSVTSLLKEVDKSIVFDKPNGQHSILELLWHIVTWREFTISRLRPSDKTVDFFEENDWRQLDHSNKALWEDGLQRLNETQKELAGLLSSEDDSILRQKVPQRDYDYKNLLYGIIHHDIYHLGQIAYINKLLTNK
jgi:uncharacterized damage-inducible protein DinB